MQNLSLLVIRVANINKSKAFYELFGFEFIEEKHGSGVLHYSSQINGIVFELYPATAARPVSLGIRLGFELDNITITKSSILAAGGAVSNTARQDVLLTDPDGIQIELQGCAIGAE